MSGYVQKPFDWRRLLSPLVSGFTSIPSGRNLSMNEYEAEFDQINGLVSARFPVQVLRAQAHVRNKTGKKPVYRKRCK